MLVIRFARTGKRHQAYFRIVVSDKRKTPTAKFVEILGNYDPHAKKLSIDQEKLQEYMKNGAVPSNSVAKLLKSEKIEMPKWVVIKQKTKKPKQKKGASEAPKTEAPKPAEEGSPSTSAQDVADAPEKSQPEAEKSNKESNVASENSEASQDKSDGPESNSASNDATLDKGDSDNKAPEKVASLDSESNESKQKPEAKEDKK